MASEDNAAAHAEPSSMPTETDSEVWNHFTKDKGGDNQNARAVCNYCEASFVCDFENHGTSNMMMHLLSQCEKCPYPTVDKLKTLTPKDDDEDGSSESDDGEDGSSESDDGEDGSSEGYISSDSSAASGFICNAERSRKVLAKLIIVENLPFSFVEKHGGFHNFCAALQPGFCLPTPHEVLKDCFQIFIDKKIKLKNLLKARRFERVCLSTNVWTSEVESNYVITAAHFIDDNWNLHRKILSVCLVHDLEGVTMAEVVEECLREWGIERVFTITENAGYKDEVISCLVKKFDNWNEQALENGFIHVTCFVRILNLIVSDSLKEFSDSIGRIRNAVSLVWHSSEYSRQFKSCMRKENLPAKRVVCIDFPSMWDSTYMMLDAAVICRRAFNRLEEQNAKYVSELNAGESIKGPSLEDWENAHVLVKFLKVFHDVTKEISRSSAITSSKFLEKCVVLNELIRKYSSSDDPLSSSMAKSMKAKYDKYWGDTNKTNYLLYVATVLDPRFKMGFVEYSFDRLYGSEIGSEMAKKVETTLRSLYDEYTVNFSDPYNDHCNRGAVPPSISTAGSTETLTKTEVDLYLEESLENLNYAFDVLRWWKVNSSKYKILGCIAKDVLAIPISTMASISTFSTDGNVVDPRDSVYYPKTLEALICAQNWLQPSTDLDLQEKIEAIEHAGNEAFSFDEYAPDSN